MKHGKKPTRTQRKLLIHLQMDPNEWFVVKDTAEYLIVVKRGENENVQKILFKER